MRRYLAWFILGTATCIGGCRTSGEYIARLLLTFVGGFLLDEFFQELVKK